MGDATVETSWGLGVVLRGSGRPVASASILKEWTITQERLTDWLKPTDEDGERVVLGAAFLVMLVSFWPTLLSLPGTWSMLYGHGHGYFVAGLTGWLIWRDRRHLLASSGPGLPDLLPVVALLTVAWMFGVIMNVRVVHQALFVTIAAMWAMTAFGRPAFRIVLPIALTALLAVPLWGSLTPVLQRATVVMSGGATLLAGIEAEVGYDWIRLSSGTFLVEGGCAGVNYLIGGVVLGAFYVHLFVKRWQTQLKIVALAGAVSIVGNWVRVTALVFIGEWSQMRSTLLEDHLWQGWLIFTLLMIPTYFVARVIERRDADKPGSAGPAAEADVALDPPRVRRALVAGAIAMLGPVLYTGIGAIPRGNDLEDEPRAFGLEASWSVAELSDAEAPEWRPAFEGVDRRLSWLLSNGDVRVDLARHYYTDQKQGEELIQWGNRIAPDPLLVSERFVGPVGQSRRIVREAIVMVEDQPQVVWYWYRVAGVDTPFPSKAKLLEIISFFRRSSAAELVTLSAECMGDSCVEAAQTLWSAMGGEDSGAPQASTSVELPEGAEAISFLGEPLMPPEQSDAVRAVYLERYAEAEDALVAAPEDADALIWMGRRTAYLGQYRSAIDIYTYALTLHPEEARLYRHRGHRYLSVREPDNAIADFERAVELTAGQPDRIEPDGLPNRLNTPTSTLQFNIWYHLALAHYVKGDLVAALEAQRACLAVSVHPDSVVAISYWLYMTLRRLGMDAEAAALLDGISAEMEVIESDGYLDLLLLFKGERTLEDLLGPDGNEATVASTTTAYGLGLWHMLNGRTDDARRTWERILTGRNQWAAFGFLVAESELARKTVP